MKRAIVNNGIENQRPIWAPAHPGLASVEPVGGGIGDAMEELKLPVREVRRGAHLFRANDVPDFVYLIRSGSVKLYLLSPNGDEQTIGFRFAGDIVGIEALGACEYGTAAIALEPTRVQAVPRQWLEQRSQRDAALQHKLFSHVSRRVAELEEQMLVLGRLGAVERLAAFLVRLSDRLFDRDTKRPAITLSMSRYDIASYLGMAFETVSRLFSQLEEEGLIRVERRRVYIEDRERLGTLAGLGHGFAGRMIPAHAAPGHA
jgi:CRP/FNR family transcriptional regulator